MCVALCLVTLSESVFWGWWSLSLLPHLCNFGTFFLPILKYCSPVCGVSCWLLPSASWAPGVFGGQALPWSEILFIVSSTSCCWTVLLDFMLLDCVAGLYVAGLCCWTVLLDFMLLDCIWCARLRWTRIIDCSVNSHLLPPEWDFLHESSKCQDVNIPICKVFPAGRLCLKTFPSNDLRFTVFDTGRLDWFKEQSTVLEVFRKQFINNFVFPLGPVPLGFPAGGRGASVSACADLTNQLLSCSADPRICLDKNTETAIVDDRWTGWGDTTPCTVNWCKKVPSGVPD